MDRRINVIGTGEYEGVYFGYIVEVEGKFWAFPHGAVGWKRRQGPFDTELGARLRVKSSASWVVAAENVTPELLGEA